MPLQSLLPPPPPQERKTPRFPLTFASEGRVVWRVVALGVFLSLECGRAVNLALCSEERQGWGFILVSD